MLKHRPALLAAIVLANTPELLFVLPAAADEQRNWAGPPPWTNSHLEQVPGFDVTDSEGTALTAWANTSNSNGSPRRANPPGTGLPSGLETVAEGNLYPYREGTPAPPRVWPPPEVLNPTRREGNPPEGRKSPVGVVDEDLTDSFSDEYNLPRKPLESATERSSSAQYEWQLLPRGLLYQSYLAGPREPRFGYAWLYDTRNETWVNDVALGGRLGVLRFGDHDPFLPEGWQLDIEGAAFPRLAETSLDLIATDYRFGIPLTWHRGPYQWKLAYYHLSSHVGDEYLLNTAPGFDRINFSRNAMVLGLGYFVTADLRLYAETGYGFLNDGGNQPWEFQFGAEYRPVVPTGWRGAPFLAANAHLREEVNFGGSFNFMAGWAWQSLDSNCLLRAGIQYSTGHTSQFEFLGQTEELVGLGLWLDF